MEQPVPVGRILLAEACPRPLGRGALPAGAAYRWYVQPMPVRKFASDDAQEPFREWVANKPRGYVLNTHSGLSDRDSTRLHRAGCFTLTPGFGGGARQTADYIKVCSPDPKELNEWAVGNLGYGLRSLRCQPCEPTSLGLTD